MFETKKEEFKTPYKCAYCGKAYYSIPERTKCETACAAKMVEEEKKIKKEQKDKAKKDTLDYVNGLWDKANEARKMAENAEKEMIKKYPDLKNRSNDTTYPPNYFITFDIPDYGSDEYIKKIKKSIFDELNSARVKW